MAGPCHRTHEATSETARAPGQGLGIRLGAALGVALTAAAACAQVDPRGSEPFPAVLLSGAKTDGAGCEQQFCSGDNEVTCRYQGKDYAFDCEDACARDGGESTGECDDDYGMCVCEASDADDDDDDDDDSPQCDEQFCSGDNEVTCRYDGEDYTFDCEDACARDGGRSTGECDDDRGMCICDADSGGEPQTRVFRVFAKDSIQRLNDAEPPPQALTDAEKNGENRYQEINAFYGLADCIRGALDERPDEDWGGAQWSTGEFRTYAEFEMSVTCRGSEADEPTIRQITSDGGDELWKFVQGSVDLLQVAIDRDGSEWSVDYVLSGQPAEVIENFGLGCPAMSDVMPRDNKSIFHHGQLTVGCEGGVPKVDLDIVGSDSSDFPTHNAWLFEVDGDDRDLVDFVREPQNDFRDLWSLPDVPELD